MYLRAVFVLVDTYDITYYNTYIGKNKMLQTRALSYNLRV